MGSSSHVAADHRLPRDVGRILGTNVRSLRACSPACSATYADHPGEPDINYFLDAGPPPVVWLEHDRMQEVELPIDLLPAFERNLVVRVLMYAIDVVLHAGAVVDDRR